jgi:hypothetical protein
MWERVWRRQVFVACFTRRERTLLYLRSKRFEESKTFQARGGLSAPGHCAGEVWEWQEVQEYFTKKTVSWSLGKSSYEELATTYEVIVIEGAGSAVEMNLLDRDIVN